MAEKNGPAEPQETNESEKPSRKPANESDAFEKERLKLVRKLQEKALEQTDPLAANVEMLCGDLIGFASRVRKALEKETPDTPVTSTGYKAFERKADLFLKLTRQIDRFAQIQRQQLAEE